MVTDLYDIKIEDIRIKNIKYIITLSIDATGNIFAVKSPSAFVDKKKKDVCGHWWSSKVTVGQLWLYTSTLIKRQIEVIHRFKKTKEDCILLVMADAQGDLVLGKPIVFWIWIMHRLYFSFFLGGWGEVIGVKQKKGFHPCKSFISYFF